MNAGGDSLLQKYGPLPEVLKALYPEYPWEPHRFVKAGKPNTTATLDGQRELLENIGKKLGVKEVIILLC